MNTRRPTNKRLLGPLAIAAACLLVMPAIAAADDLAPQTTITAASPTSGGVSPDGSAAFNYASTEPGSRFVCALGSGSGAPSYSACGAGSTSYTGLSDGVYIFRVRAIDAAGNADASPASSSFVVDKSEPLTRLATHPPALSTSASAQFTFDGGFGGDRYECALDGAGFTPCMQPDAAQMGSASYSGLGNGSHTFSVRTVDRSGRADSSPASFTWAIDPSGGPGGSDSAAVSLLKAPKAKTTSARAAFRFEVTPRVGKVKLECRLDRKRWVDCSNGRFSKRVELGRHTFLVRAVGTSLSSELTVAGLSYTFTRIAR